MSVETRSPGILRFATFEMDIRAGELRQKGKRIRLQEQPFQVLAVLVQRSGDVVTRDELRTRIWPRDTFVDFDNSLNTAVNKVREALGDSVESPHFVETLPRRGYRFLAAVNNIEAGVAAQDVRKGVRAKSRPLRLGLVAILLFAVLAVTVSLNVSRIRD